MPSLPVSLGRLVLVCAVSIAAWSPCWLELADVGGYQAVSENHRRYVVGLSGAIPSAGRQLSALTCLEGPLGRWSLLLALLCVVGRFPRSANPRSSPIRIVCALLLGLAPLVVGSTLLTGLAAAIWCSTLLWPAAAHERRSLAPWLLAAWWGGLTMAVPCYTPYPRLALPWLVAGWLASGALFARWWGPEPAAIHKSEHPPPAGNRMDRNQWTQWAGSLMAAAGALAGVVWIAASSRAVETPPWRPQHGLQQAARELLGDIQQQLQSGKLPGEAWVVYVYGEPALFYQLKLAGVADCHPVQDLAFSRSETADRAATFLVIGDRTLRDPEFRKQLRSERRLELVRERTVAVPPLVWLDEPWEPIDASRVDREWDLELWRVKPGG